mmetsp:Transcript_35086/g.52370  ORF Transcript_35086/g.52370 Transcript_35086/m.52370 type:complete len:373 (-) Transcript_35086:271-1389(-)
MEKESSNTAKRCKKKVHPLQMPLRTSPTSGLTICRFHNYDRCKKYDDPQAHCPLDHESCHICFTKGHVALNCTSYHDENAFSKFQQDFTLENTRPEDYPTKTALGNAIIWIDKLGYPEMTDTRPFFKPGDDQLLRCRKLKRKEQTFLTTLSPGSTFVDVGAHFGDTVLTMALYAKVNELDITFFAFEPSPDKCRWIRKVASANELNVQVYCVAVGDGSRTVQPDPRKKDRALLDGSLMYKEIQQHSTTDNDVHDDDDDDDNNTPTENAVEMIALDSLIHQLSPLGFLHIDVEGWEYKVIQGAQTLIESSSSTPCYILAESWKEKDCKRRGIVDADPEELIDGVMKEFQDFVRLDDIVDIERNLVYAKDGYKV